MHRFSIIFILLVLLAGGSHAAREKKRVLYIHLFDQSWEKPLFHPAEPLFATPLEKFWQGDEHREIAASTFFELESKIDELDLEKPFTHLSIAGHGTKIQYGLMTLGSGTASGVTLRFNMRRSDRATEDFFHRLRPYLVENPTIALMGCNVMEIEENEEFDQLIKGIVTTTGLRQFTLLGPNVVYRPYFTSIFPAAKGGLEYDKLTSSTWTLAKLIWPLGLFMGLDRSARAHHRSPRDIVTSVASSIATLTYETRTILQSVVEFEYVNGVSKLEQTCTKIGVHGGIAISGERGTCHKFLIEDS